MHFHSPHVKISFVMIIESTAQYQLCWFCFNKWMQLKSYYISRVEMAFSGQTRTESRFQIHELINIDMTMK